MAPHAEALSFLRRISEALGPVLAGHFTGTVELCNVTLFVETTIPFVMMGSNVRFPPIADVRRKDQNHGTRIAAISAELHVFDEKVNFACPIRLAVSFDDGSFMRLRGSGDGDGLIVDRLPLEEPMDMEEYGRTATFDFTDRLDGTLRGAVIVESLAIRNPSGRLIGLAMTREMREPFCIWIDGDEFHWGPVAALRSHDWLAGSEPEIEGPLAV